MDYVLTYLTWSLLFLPAGLPIGCVVGTLVGGDLMERVAPYLTGQRRWTSRTGRSELLKAALLIFHLGAFSLFVWAMLPKAIVGYQIGLWIASARMVRYLTNTKVAGEVRRLPVSESVR